MSKPLWIFPEQTDFFWAVLPMGLFSSQILYFPFFWLNISKCNSYTTFFSEYRISPPCTRQFEIYTRLTLVALCIIDHTRKLFSYLSLPTTTCGCYLVTKSWPSDSLMPHGLQHTRLPCPSLSPGVCSNSCLLSQWCYPTVSSSASPYFFCLQSCPASGSFPVNQLFTSGGHSTGALASASVLPMNIRVDFL